MPTQRTVLRVQMRPIAGSRFQPTGFPDLGPATFQRPVGETEMQQCVLVESNQSMANRLEGTLWSEGDQAPVEMIAALPWIRVTAADDGRYVTSSRTEAHRLASAFVKQSELDGVGMTETIKERLALRDDTPLAPRHLARAIFALDPMCLLHGVFFADSAWPVNPRWPGPSLEQ
jgi:CRISPR-associated protein Csb1